MSWRLRVGSGHAVFLRSWTHRTVVHRCCALVEVNVCLRARGANACARTCERARALVRLCACALVR
eukprot:7861101-Alexandrium_andersonii.AAC.1